MLLALTKHGATLALRGRDVNSAVLGVLRVSGRFWGSAAGACLSVEAEVHHEGSGRERRADVEALAGG